MKFRQRLNHLCARWHTRVSFNCMKTRLLFRYLLWHTCWCSLLVGAIILAVGIILRTRLIHSSNGQLVQISGLCFIIIGGFLIVLSPAIALYELSGPKQRNRTGSNNGQVEANDGLECTDETEQVGSIEYRSELPSYDEVAKNSATGSFPRRLQVDSFSNSSQPTMPPAYNEIIRTESMHSRVSHQHPYASQPTSTVPSKRNSAATISPSPQLVESNADHHNTEYYSTNHSN